MATDSYDLNTVLHSLLRSRESLDLDHLDLGVTRQTLLSLKSNVEELMWTRGETREMVTRLPVLNNFRVTS